MTSPALDTTHPDDSLAHLSRVMHRLEAVRDVRAVARDQLPGSR